MKSTVQHSTNCHTEKQGAVHFFCNKSKDYRKKRRDQSPPCPDKHRTIHKNISPFLFKICTMRRRKRSGRICSRSFCFDTRMCLLLYKKYRKITRQSFQTAAFYSITTADSQLCSVIVPSVRISSLRVFSSPTLDKSTLPVRPSRSSVHASVP